MPVVECPVLGGALLMVRREGFKTGDKPPTPEFTMRVKVLFFAIGFLIVMMCSIIVVLI